MRLGSLFDGIAGFPLAAQRCGIESVWASEIEPFPIKVSKRHFPNMIHLGDIRNINGTEVEPVDIITFGSPCQDLSVAGKRKGLEGSKSHLFYEAIRIIREMREVTQNEYPTFAIWENVPGALSSNSGNDFKAVIGTFVEVGAVDIAWRILDAQYFGVPQRRRRIFLVADFRGERAGEILFEPEGLRGDIAESRKARKEVAASAGDGIAKSIGVNGRQNPCCYGDKTGTSDTNPLTQCVAACLTSGTGRRYDAETETLIPVTLTGQNVTRSLIARADSSPCIDRGQEIVFVQKTAGTLCASGAGMSRPAGMASETDLIVPMAFLDPANPLLAKGNLSHRGDTDNIVAVNYAVRRLTPTECERLQGYPDGWTEGGSDTARYKALGNSVAVPVVEWIMRRLIDKGGVT